MLNILLVKMMYCSEDDKSSGSNLDASQAANENEREGYQEQNRSVAFSQTALFPKYLHNPAFLYMTFTILLQHLSQCTHECRCHICRKSVAVPSDNYTTEDDTPLAELKQKLTAVNRLTQPNRCVDKIGFNFLTKQQNICEFL
jgi:hypothetical protein